MTADEITRKLLARAEELNLSDRELGRRSGIGHATISRIRRRHRYPALPTLITLAETLGYRIILTRTP